METNKVTRREPNNATGGACAPGLLNTDALGWWLKDSWVSLTAWTPPVVLCRLLQGTLLAFHLCWYLNTWEWNSTDWLTPPLMNATPRALCSPSCPVLDLRWRRACVLAPAGARSFRCPHQSWQTWCIQNPVWPAHISQTTTPAGGTVDVWGEREREREKGGMCQLV